MLRPSMDWAMASRVHGAFRRPMPTTERAAVKNSASHSERVPFVTLREIATAFAPVPTRCSRTAPRGPSRTPAGPPCTWRSACAAAFRLPASASSLESSPKRSHRSRRRRLNVASFTRTRFCSTLIARLSHCSIVVAITSSPGSSAYCTSRNWCASHTCPHSPCHCCAPNRSDTHTFGCAPASARAEAAQRSRLAVPHIVPQSGQLDAVPRIQGAQRLQAAGQLRAAAGALEAAQLAGTPPDFGAIGGTRLRQQLLQANCCLGTGEYLRDLILLEHPQAMAQSVRAC